MEMFISSKQMNLDSSIKLQTFCWNCNNLFTYMSKAFNIVNIDKLNNMPTYLTPSVVSLQTTSRDAKEELFYSYLYIYIFTLPKHTKPIIFTDSIIITATQVKYISSTYNIRSTYNHIYTVPMLRSYSIQTK